MSVGLTELQDVKRAIAEAREISDRVLVEDCFDGQDLRLVVIDYQVVAAAVRRPPCVVGDGQSTIRALIEHRRWSRVSKVQAEVHNKLLDRFASLDLAKWGQQAGEAVAFIVQAFADGKVGDILFTSAKIAFANAVNFLAGALMAVAQVAGETMAQALPQFITADLNNRLNAVMKVLTVVAVIFLPPTLIAGIYGMNVPLPQFPGGEGAQFWWLVGLTLAVMAGMLAAFRAKDWL